MRLYILSNWRGEALKELDDMLGKELLEEN